MQLYAISGRRALDTGDEQESARRLVELASEWALGGVDYIQVREKDLDGAGLEQLVCRMVMAVRASSSLGFTGGRGAKVLVNSGCFKAARIAVAAGADGVHLPGAVAEVEAIEEVRRCFAPRKAVVSVACHSAPDVELARESGADVVLFAPVFEKVLESGVVLPGVGLDALAAACRLAGKMPVFALGGVTVGNAQVCVDAGAAGIAGIRLFQNESWRKFEAARFRNPF